MRKVLASAALIGSLFSLPSAVQADPLQVTGGGLSLDFEGYILVFTGSDFLLRHAPDPTNLGLFIPSIAVPDSCFICHAGDQLNQSFTTPGVEYLGIGDATIGGTTYDDVTFRGTLDFRAEPVTLPAGLPDGSFFTASAPFVFNGEVAGFRGETELFRLPLFGNGAVSSGFFLFDGRFIPEEGEEPLFLFDDVVATPEPSTLTLVALGIAGVVRARWTPKKRA
jgi:hypothetical protein